MAAGSLCWSSLVAELMAIRGGLLFAAEFCLDHLILESDSLQTVNMINSSEILCV